MPQILFYFILIDLFWDRKSIFPSNRQCKYVSSKICALPSCFSSSTSSNEAISYNLEMIAQNDNNSSEEDVLVYANQR